MSAVKVLSKVVNGIVVDAIMNDEVLEGWVELPAHIGIGMATTAPAPALTVTDITNAVQAHLDATAKTRNYDGILSCASYATSTSPTFAAEAAAAIAWRDAVWNYCYTQLALVQAGQRAIPADTASLIAELPSIAW